MAQWSPIGHSLAIVLDNDLYYLEDASAMTRSKRLTSNGATDLLFNGIADWLYEGIVEEWVTGNPDFGYHYVRF